ncbi:target of Sbf [Saitoella coloradoensis]
MARLSTFLLGSAAFLSALVGVNADCSQISGNYYCDAVSAIEYQNIGFSGSYQQVTAMDTSSCTCTSQTKSFSGSLAPVNEELSLHFRGPIQIAKVAVYNLQSGSSAAKKRDVESSSSSSDCPKAKRTGHSHHRRSAVVEEVWITETVHTTITRTRGVADGTAAAAIPATTSASTAANGNVVAVVVDDIVSAASEVASVAGDVVGDIAGAVTSVAGAVASVIAGAGSDFSSSSSSSSSTSSSSSAAPSVTGTAWVRSSFYEASSGTSENIVFMNNMGGVNGSGSWSSCFGNTLSYANANGVDAAAVPQILEDVTIPSNKEVIIFSGEACDDSCGYVADGAPAYKGFSGGDKMFLFEFMMPTDSASTSSFNLDMPAIWALNAQIPRTLQYGDASCSCWTTGCGELDLFEVLTTGLDYMTTTLHDFQGTGTQYGGGGSSDYFVRPKTSYMQAAVVFSSSDKTIKLAEISNVDFGSSITLDTVSGWGSNPSSIYVAS